MMARNPEEQDIERLLEEIPRIRHLDAYDGGYEVDFRIWDEILNGICYSSVPPGHEGASCSDWSSSSSRSGPDSPSLTEWARKPAGFAAMVEKTRLVENLRNVRLGADQNGSVLPPTSALNSRPIGSFQFQDNNRPADRGCEAFFHPFGWDSLMNADGNSSLTQFQRHYPGAANLVDPLLRKSSYGAADLDTGRQMNPHYWGNHSGNFASFPNKPYPISDVLLQSEMTRVDPNWDNASDGLNLPIRAGHQPVRMARNTSDASFAREMGLHCTKNQRNAQGTSVKRVAPFIKYENLMGVKGHLYLLAKDQHGCRYLQQMLDEGKHQVDTIFNGVINSTVELMVDPFGNYLMQKLLGKCNEEQLMAILLMLNKNPANVVGISLNIHGTRAVQKLIDTVKTKHHISLVTSALRPGFVNLVKDLNGSHVLQRCLETFTTEDNKFIFDAAAMYCVDIATHRHGCCVLQKCIRNFTGEYQEKLVAVVATNGNKLAQDPYGNYVVQAVLELEKPFAIAILASQFQGRYVELSTQKFSSNVVERCFLYFGKDFPATIIDELLSVPHFDQLLQHPYANYPIQRALEYSKGQSHAALEKAIRPYAPTLRTNPYCRQIYSKLVSKK
ncbi:putative pumilio homolog 8, chloroplastic [Zingiber officinale]|uniref:putative pumilio homolog 8, chloroplastic n=1 Tax=Zingiber officinale TaxID=94328 RepID=UPI001C4CD06E|nr:putative pumilio homolog 8, chloroplastic [Zingiber officinale]